MAEYILLDFALASSLTESKDAFPLPSQLASYDASSLQWAHQKPVLIFSVGS